MDTTERTLIEQLEHRVAQLEADVVELRAGAATRRRPVATTAWPAPSARPLRSATVEARRPWPSPVEVRPPPERAPIEIDSEVVLKWGGVGLVVLAVAFAVSTAITRGWIGPELQLAGAVALACLLAAVGVRLRPVSRGWTHALCTAGALALVITCSSSLFRDEAGDTAVLVGTAIATAAGIALAWFVTSQWVAAATVIVGALAWFTSREGEPPVVATAVWIGALVVIVITLALRRSWFAVRFAAHLAGLAALAVVAAQAEGAGEQAAAVAVAAVLALSLLWVPSRGDGASPWQQFEIQLSAVLGPWALAVICAAFGFSSDRGVGAVGLGVAAGLGLVILATRRRLRDSHVVSLLIGASVTLSIGLAALLSAEAALVAIAVQGAGLVVLAPRLDRSVLVYVNAAALLVLSSLITLGRMVDGWRDDLPIGDDVAHLAVVVAVGFAGWQTRDPILRRITAMVVLVLVMVWTGSVFAHLPQGQAIVSVVWAVIGTAVLVAGAVRKVPDLGTVGLVVLGVTVGKLLTVDLAEVDTLWRAGLFLVIGLGFLRLGFLIPRLTGRKR